MSDDRPNPLSDVAKGLGLLFRAARTVVGKIPKGDLEAAVVASAREVGRAIENVASSLERGVTGRKDRRGEPTKPRQAGARDDASATGPSSKPEPPHSS